MGQNDNTFEKNSERNVDRNKNVVFSDGLWLRFHLKGYLWKSFCVWDEKGTQVFNNSSRVKENCCVWGQFVKSNGRVMCIYVDAYAFAFIGKSLSLLCSRDRGIKNVNIKEKTVTMGN